MVVIELSQLYQGKSIAFRVVVGDAVPSRWQMLTQVTRRCRQMSLTGQIRPKLCIFVLLGLVFDDNEQTIARGAARAGNAGNCQ